MTLQVLDGGQNIKLTPVSPFSIKTYKLKITTTVKDKSGNGFSSEYKTTNGFSIGLTLSLTKISPQTTMNDLRSITYGASQYLAVSQNTLLLSTDGKTWSPNQLYDFYDANDLLANMLWGLEIKI